MSRVHTVTPGDWIGSIAHAYDLRPSALWEHPTNAPLRELRKSSDLLMVGDEIHIPDDEDGGGIEVPTGRRVVFRQRAGHRLRIRVAGADLFVAAFGPLPYRLELFADSGAEETEGELTEAAAGVIDVPLPNATTRARLTIRGWARDLPVGGLGPVDEDAGAQARLVNLGFTLPVHEDDPEEIDNATAVRRFKDLHDLGRDQTLDPATRSRLAREYGDAAVDGQS